MTPAERAAVHALAGAFGRLSLAAELVALTPPGRARAAMVDRMECARKLALAEFSAAQNVLAAENSASAAKAPRDPTLADLALDLAAKGPIAGPQLADATGRALTVCLTTLSKLRTKGLLVYTPPPNRGRGSTARGTYSLPEPAAERVAFAEMSSAPPPPPRAAQTPVPSTQPVAPGAGDGRAVSPRPPIPSGSKQSAAALLWAQHGSFTAAELAAAGGFRLLSLRTTLCELRDKGFLRFVPPEKRGTREAGYYEPAASVEVLREAAARAGKRNRSEAGRVAQAVRRGASKTYARSRAQRASTAPAEPLTDHLMAQYGVRRVPVEQALTSSPRPSQAQRVADFFATREPLPPARPPVFLERGVRHG